MTYYYVTVALPSGVHVTQRFESLTARILWVIGLGTHHLVVVREWEATA